MNIMYEKEPSHEKNINKVKTLRSNACMYYYMFVCVEVLRPSQPNGVMLSAVSLPNHTYM